MSDTQEGSDPPSVYNVVDKKIVYESSEIPIHLMDNVTSDFEIEERAFYN